MISQKICEPLIGTEEKIRIDFKGKCQNNSLERIDLENEE